VTRSSIKTLTTSIHLRKRDGDNTDANHNSDNANDDQVWKNGMRFGDRYINIVFPSNPAFANIPPKRSVCALNATATTDVKIGVTNCKAATHGNLPR